MPGRITSTRRRHRKPSPSTQKGTCKLADQQVTRAVGRRKTAIARVRLTPGDGRIIINDKTPLQYLGRRVLEMEGMQPLRVAEMLRRFAVRVRGRGGGGAGRAPDRRRAHEGKKEVRPEACPQGPSIHKAVDGAGETGFPPSPLPAKWR